MQVTTKTDGREVTVEFDFGSTLQDSLEKFGEEKVHGHFVRNAKIALQGMVGRMIKAEKSDDEIAKAVSEFDLTARKPGKTNVEKAAEIASKMTPEERQALLEQLGVAAAKKGK